MLTGYRRYLMYTLGALALAFSFVRIFLFKIPESPRYLLSRNRDSEAVEAVNYIARYNKKPELLTLAMFQQIDHDLGVVVGSDDGRQGLSPKEILMENLADFRLLNFKRLFATRKLAQHTSITWLIWLVIGIAYPLYFNFLPTYLAQRFTGDSSLNTTYRNYCIESAVGIVGPLAASVMIQTKLGRRYVMVLSSIVTSIFMFAYTAAKTPEASLAFASITGMIGNLGMIFSLLPFFPLFKDYLLTRLM
jgi:Major Facilitator Superfamily.